MKEKSYGKKRVGHAGQPEPLSPKELWDEYRITKQISEGMWWLVSEPYVPEWFMVKELEWRGQGIHAWPEDDGNSIWDEMQT